MDKSQRDFKLSNLQNTHKNLTNEPTENYFQTEGEHLRGLTLRWQLGQPAPTGASRGIIAVRRTRHLIAY